MDTRIKFYEVGFSAGNYWSVVATYLDSKRAVDAIPLHAKGCIKAIGDRLTVKEVQKERIYKESSFVGSEKGYAVYCSISNYPLAIFDTVDSCEIHAAKLIEARPEFEKYIYIDLVK